MLWFLISERGNIKWVEKGIGRKKGHWIGHESFFYENRMLKNKNQLKELLRRIDKRTFLTDILFQQKEFLLLINKLKIEYKPKMSSNLR